VSFGTVSFGTVSFGTTVSDTPGDAVPAAGADEPLAQPAATTAATINATAPLRLPCPDISPPAM